MLFNFRSKKYYAYCGDGRKTVFAEIYRSKAGFPAMRLQGSDQIGESCNPETVGLLLEQSSPQSGKVAMALPLQFFEVVTLQLSIMPDEAVAKALPYNLAKQVSRPLGEYLYDWQITKRKKDHLLITVYLFPREIYKPLAEKFARSKLELAYLEADVFAAFSFLDSQGSLVDGEAVLLTIIWPDSISFAVWNNDILVLTRSMNLKRPERQDPETEPVVDKSNVEPGQPSPSPEGKSDRRETEKPLEVEPEGNDIVAAYDQGDSLLAGFEILAPDSIGHQDDAAPPKDIGSDDLVLELEEPGEEKEPEPPKPRIKTERENYLANINLEILRTRDYYTSIVKGQPIKSYFVLGAEDFSPELEEYLEKSLGEKPRRVMKDSGDPECPAALSVLGIGTGARW